MLMVGMSECSRFSCKHACRYKTCSYLLGQKGCFHLRMSLCSFFWWQCSCLAYQCSCLPPHICHVRMFISDCSTTQSRALAAFTVLTSYLFLFQISTVLSFLISGKRLSIILLEIIKVFHLSPLHISKSRMTLFTLFKRFSYGKWTATSIFEK